MRVKVILSASVLAILILAPAIYFRFAPATPAPVQAPPATEDVAANSQPVTPPVSHHPRSIVPANNGEGVTAPGEDTSSAPNAEEAMQDRMAQLTQLGASDDPNDLHTLVASLNDKQPEIRKTALDAIVQFGSKDAIPALEKEMQWTEDPQEKVDIINAIKYLQLPSFQEFSANLAAGTANQSSEQPAPGN